MTPSTTHTARAARLLAVLLVPMVALPALAGLVVCASGGGVTTSWGETPCPRKQSAPGTTFTPDTATSACVVVPDGLDAPLASAPELRAPAVLAVPAPYAASPLSTVAPVAFLDGARGPPTGTLGALRTTVLRV